MLIPCFRTKNSLTLFSQCGVEQLVARRAHNPKVARSSRVPATKQDASGKLLGASFFCPSVSLLEKSIR